MSVQSGAVGFYRARKPQETPLYRLVEAHYGQVKGVWEEGFEQSCGFWRVFVDDVVNAYLDCGRLESGFVRVRCSKCGVEFLVATSCQKRGFCPSCGTKRAAAFGAFLADEVLEEVGHLMWTFSLPKMIRPFFIYHPELRGRLCRVAFDTVQEMMAAAAGESDGFRTGMVAFAATAGDLLNINPHVHAIAPRGGWDSDGAPFGDQCPRPSTTPEPPLTGPSRPQPLIPGLPDQRTAKLCDLIWNDEEAPVQDPQKASEDSENFLWGSKWGSN